MPARSCTVTLATVVAAGALLLSGCVASAPTTPTTAAPTPDAGTGQPVAIEIPEPANVGDAKTQAKAYHDSGAYLQDLAVVADAATAWVQERAPQVDRPAVVFDIDDTALSNWEVILADDFGRVIQGPCTSLPEGPCGWRSWDLGAHDVALPPTLGFYDAAREAGAAIFFITGRDEGQRAATVENLDSAGFGTYEGLLMPATGASYPSASAFKTPERQRIEEQGYTIIANIGDQPSDLEGGFAERVFLLPNPFYRIP